MAVAWKVADSLEQLRTQLNALAPGRSTAADGSIGDGAHASRDSDHNPWWSFAGQAYVTARDFTHDPAGGLDCEWLSLALEYGRDQRVKYMIWDRRIMSGDAGPSPWAWRDYSGPNAHEHHLHLSVMPDARSLVRIPWRLSTAAVTPHPEDDDMQPDERAALFQVRDMLSQLKPGVVLPARSNAAAARSPRGDDAFGAALWAWGEAADARAGIEHVSTQVAQLAGSLHDLSVSSGVDPDALAARVADMIAARLRD